MSEDRRLLQEYEGGGSRAALEELIGRHLGLVYSSALRQVRDVHLAEDVTQAVFLVLTQKGRTIRRGEAVGGWLLAVTRAVSVNAMKQRATQKKHEVQAAKPEVAASPLDQWENIAPKLDHALHRLSRLDRDAIVLRFFQDQSFAGVGAQLGLSEEAARKRVTRALDRMRSLLVGQNNSFDAGALSVAIGTFAVQAPPASLSAGAIATSLASPSPLSSSLTKGALKMIAWTKAKVAAVIIATAVVGSLGALLVTQELSQPPDATMAAAATNNESTPVDTADATNPAADVADAAAKPIFMEARIILMSPALQDEFRINEIILAEKVTNIVAGNLPTFHASIIDNFTLNLLMSSVQKDKGSEVTTIPKMKSEQGAYYELKVAEKNPLLTIGMKPQIGDPRWVEMSVTPMLHNPAATGYLVPTLIARSRTADLDPSAQENTTVLQVPAGATFVIDAGVVSASFSDARTTTAPATMPAPRRMFILLQPTIGAPATQPVPLANHN